MDNTNILQRNIKLNKKGAIYALTIIAVILSVFRIGYIVSCALDYMYLDSLFEFIPLIISVILFLVHISGPYKKGKAAAIVPIVFLLDTIALFFVSISCYGILHLVIIAEILAFVCSLRGFNNRKLFVFIMISILAMVASLPVSVSIVYSYISEEAIIFRYYLPATAVFVYNLALLIFGANNKIPYVIKPKSKKNKVLTPEEELAALKELYDFRKISEEEYIEKRMEIINKI